MILVIVCGTSIFVRNCICSAVLGKSGELPGRSTSQTLISIETGTDQVWQDISPFLGSYSDQIPAETSKDFLLRKMLLEKIQSGVGFWTSLLQKNAELSSLRSAIRMSGGVRQSETFPSIFHVPFASLKFAWGGGWYCLLVSLAILRVILISRIPGELVEVFPAVFSMVGVVAILIFTETAEQYDIFLAFPLAMAAARVLAVRGAGGGNCSVVKPRTGCEVRSAVWQPRSLIFGAVFLLAMLVVIHLAIAEILSTQPRWTFTQPRLSDENSGRGEIDSGRYASVVLAEASPVLVVGVIAKATFVVAEEDLSTDQLRFFVSYDQRRQRLWGKLPFADLPLRYCVAVDGSPVADGRLEDLANAKFIEHPFQAKGGVHQVELLITAERDISSNEFTYSPRLAIEYVH